MMIRDKLKELIKEKYIYKSKKKDIVLSSGNKSKYYFDMKGLLMNPVGANLVMDKLVNDMNLSNISKLSVGGVEISGTILASMFSLYGYNSFFLRKKDKHNGLQKRLEGNILNDNIIIVDDVITTGNTVLDAMEYLLRFYDKTSIVGVWCIIDRSKEQKYNSLYKENDFIV